MKKILILILIVLLGMTIYMLTFKNIEIGTWRTTNLAELKELKDTLKDEIKSSKELNETSYTNQIDELNKSVKELKTTKQTYEAKMQYIGEELELGVIRVKEYKIEYLWAVIENYAKDQGITLKLDLIEIGGTNLYNLDITLRGEYQGIANFIQKIENDDTLDFKIEGFKIVPKSVTIGNTTNTNNSSTTNTNNSNTNNSNTSGKGQTIIIDTTTLQATFTIKNVKIGLN